MSQAIISSGRADTTLFGDERRVCIRMHTFVYCIQCVCLDGESPDKAEWYTVSAVTRVQGPSDSVGAVRSGVWLAGSLSYCQQLVCI